MLRMPLRPRRFGHFFACATLCMPLAILGAAHGSPVAIAATAGTTLRTGAGYELDISTSDLAIGRNRVTFGILRNNHPISTASVKVQFFFISAAGAAAEQTLVAKFNDFARDLGQSSVNMTATELRGVYVAYPTFRHSGTWGVQAAVPAGRTVQPVRQEFIVQKRGRTPSVGSPAPQSHNPTVFQESVLKLDSGRPPDDMHRLSIADAIARHRPLLVVFSSPAYCQSRMCGPETEIVQRIERKYRERFNFIHIETYKDADPSHGPASTFVQWHLETDPWVFIVNSKGTISAKFEGPTSAAEIEAAMAPLLGHSR